MLANYEEHFYITTGGAVNESLSYESQKEKLREKMNKKIVKEKALKELKVNQQASSEELWSENNSGSATDELNNDEILNCSVIVTLNIDDSLVSNALY